MVHHKHVNGDHHDGRNHDSYFDVKICFIRSDLQLPHRLGELADTMDKSQENMVLRA